MNYASFRCQISVLFTLLMCGMLSLHGGITLLYLSITSIDFSAREILALYLTGCLAVVLIPLLGTNCERVVQITLTAKLLLTLYTLLTGVAWIPLEALCSGLIASSSFYFAMREISKKQGGKLLASILILLINIESLIWYSSLGLLSEFQSRIWLTAGYGFTIILPLIYLSTFAGTAVSQRVTIKQLLTLAKSLSFYNLFSYMLAVLSVNYLNLSIKHWKEIGKQYWWGSIAGINGFYILGILTGIGILSLVKTRQGNILTTALLGLCATSYWLAANAAEDSKFIIIAVLVLGATSTMVMSSVVAGLAQGHDTISRLLVATVMATMQVCLILLIKILEMLTLTTINEWLVISIAGGILVLRKAHYLYLEVSKTK